MANELANERKIYLDFVPASLDMTNYDELKSEVEKYAAKYKGLVFDRSEKNGANQARSELLALQNAIETERKNVEQVYNQPLNEFKESIKVLVDLINDPLDDIRDGLKVIDEAEKSEREEALNTVLAEKLDGLDVTVDEIEQNIKWLNKGNWTEKLNPKKQLIAEIENTIQQTIKEKERKESERRILTEFCKAQDVDPDGWVSQLDFKSAMEVIQMIQDSIAAQKEREARQLEREKQHKELTKRNEETLKATSTPFIEVPEVKEDVFEEHLMIRGTKTQFEALNRFLVTSGIEVSPIPEGITFDDLPWN